MTVAVGALDQGAGPALTGRAVMTQRWLDLASVHWRYDPGVVQPLLPAGLTVETFDGSAWVGLIPFAMREIRLFGLPPFGPLSSFPETNVRTYVVGPDGRRGVWFASLDCTRLLPVLVARAAYRLPYRWSAMSMTHDGPTRTYETRRHRPALPSTSRLVLEVGDLLPASDVTPLDHFLTARWGLGSSVRGRILWAEVEHGAWPLHRAQVVSLDDELLAEAGLPAPAGPPHALWSPGVSVRVGRPRRVRDGTPPG